MKPQLLRLLLLLSLVCLAPQLSAQNDDGQEMDEVSWMLDQMFLSAEQMDMDPGQMFSALGHGLSIADIATAQGLLPLDLYNSVLALEEHEILDALLAGAIDKDEAKQWREENQDDVQWMIFSPDPFALEDVVWLLDGACDALDIDMLSLADYLDQGESLHDLALSWEVDPKDLEDAAIEYLEITIDTAAITEGLDSTEADEWQSWSLEWLPELLQDRNLFQTLAEDGYFEDLVADLADALGQEEDSLWDLLDQGASVDDLLEAHGLTLEELAAAWDTTAEEVDQALQDLGNWLQEDVEESMDTDRADF